MSKCELQHTENSFEVDNGLSSRESKKNNSGENQTGCPSTQNLDNINDTSIGNNQNIEIDRNSANEPRSNLPTSQPESIVSDNTTPTVARDENTTNRFPLLIFSILLLAISILIVRQKSPASPETCNMNKAENRDFNRYYGIINMRNHFITTSADACDSNIIFKPALPQTILKSDHSASSFLALAPYGTGKTVLRCEYYKSLTSDSYLKVLILNKEINEYLERFVKQRQINQADCQNENCIMKWSKYEFGQLLLSLLVTQFIDTYDKEGFDLPDISLNEKFELITIICYYFNEQDVRKLEKFVNAFLKKTKESFYRADPIHGQIKERNIFRETSVFTHLKQDLNKSSALRQDYEKLFLLCAIIQGEEYTVQAMETIKSNNVFNDLRHFALFMKNHLKRIVVFIIDGIDENRFFFEENKVNKKSLQLFGRSSLSQEIISLVMAHNFYLSIFYPKIQDINIENAIIRKDKFPILEINWNTKSLINYADYVLQEMNKNVSKTSCQSLKDFKTLVNYSDKKNAEIINQIPTPRALHFFMEKLITEMNNCANDVSKPFIANFDNIQAAYESSSKSFSKIHDINE